MKIESGCLIYTAGNRKKVCSFQGDLDDEEVEIHYTTSQVEGGQRIGLKIVPKKAIKINRLYLDTDLHLSQEDTIFLNGYQSWTESREFNPGEGIPRLNRIARLMLERYGDYGFYRPRGRVLQSWTYTYIRNRNGIDFAGSLSESFVRAVEVMYAVKGRVILSGMGKSGHIAAKITATLASTGTPAQFVHPAEASHGDLGMITPDDVVIVLSNSGETSELSDIIHHTRRFQIPLIGVASRPESTLLKAADIALVLPNAPEACAIGMAPTTSTTMTLALGDALAVAIMEKRGFQRTDFKTFHPGGKLGAQLLPVSALMHSGAALPLVSEQTPMSEALLEITAKSFGVVGITDTNGKLAGIITDGDLRRHMADGLLGQAAGTIMTTRPRTIDADALLSEALRRMTADSPKVTAIFAMRGIAPVGIVHLHDCLRAGVA